MSVLVLCLCGDLMLGRGIDRIMPTSVDPVLYEPYVRTAERYVELAEQEHGAIPRSVSPAYVWGDALEELERVNPAVSIGNLETSITDNGDPWPTKGIHYRMHPDNVGVLEQPGFDVLSLANNHVLDWGPQGLVETVRTLEDAELRFAGAGLDTKQAQAPVVVDAADEHRIRVVAVAFPDSGVPYTWASSNDAPGVFVLPDYSEDSIDELVEHISSVTARDNITIVSVHWGDNWGYRVEPDHLHTAHRLIDDAGVDIIHGHSSHHPRPIEVYNRRLILYGCGDLVNDYEGIGGRERYHPEISAIYFPEVDHHDGSSVGCRLSVFRMERFALEKACEEESARLGRTLGRVSEQFGVRAEHDGENRLSLRW